MLYHNTFTVVVASLLIAQTFAHKVVKRIPASTGLIPALLRHSVGARSDIVGRQSEDTCRFGYHACPDGKGCCPLGTYCGEWEGKLGCCPDGETCVANDNPCEFEGHILCKNENFCCQRGARCFRDDDGNPKCSEGLSPGSSDGNSTDTGTATEGTGETAATQPTPVTSGEPCNFCSFGGAGQDAGGSEAVVTVTQTGSEFSPPSVAAASNNAPPATDVNTILAICGFVAQAVLLT